MRRQLERLGEALLFVVSAGIILVVFLIFAFVLREGLPIVLGKSTTALERAVILPDEVDEVPRGELAAYLGFESTEELAEFDREILVMLLEEKMAMAEGATSPDAYENSVSWRRIFLPYQWEDYDEPSYVWQPVSEVPKYNIVPLIIGSIKATIVALVFAVPLSFFAAIYVALFAPWRVRQFVKPVIEMLAGIPSVVLGFFGLMIMATYFQDAFGFEQRLNVTVAGVALGLAVIPVTFTVMEDVLTSVPRSFADASLALGATRWQTAIRVIVPAALPGLFAACVLGFGRAIGETMVVLMVSGNASILSWDFGDSVRTITATIAAELPETVFGDVHYQMLFFLGALLFSVTFIANLVGDIVVHRMKAKLENVH